MDTILIVGVDTVVGANLAAVLSESAAVSGLTRSRGMASAARIGGCEILSDGGDSERSIRHVLGRVQPQHVVFCGPGADSCWDQVPRVAFTGNAVTHMRAWARAAQETACGFTLISSDAVFTGPWMFHPETGPGLCGSPPAQILREAEAAVLEAYTSALVVRTHVFGWTPESCGAGWIERELARLEQGAAGSHDPFRHATPMLATDFAEVLQQAWREGLGGLYHVAGAERTNPARFAQRLAQEFALPAPAASRPETLLECPRGFGCGETSLRTSTIRRELGISLPSLSDGLRRLREQAENGYRDRLNGSTVPRRQQAA